MDRFGHKTITLFKHAIRVNKIWQFSLLIGLLVNTYWNFSNSQNNKAQEIQIAELKKENSDLVRINAEIVSSQMSKANVINSFKTSVWCKAKNGNHFFMQVFNERFQNRWLDPFGVSKYSYIGNTDFAVFPYEAAKKFRKGDSLAAVSDQIIMFNETFINQDDDTISVDVMKWREITKENDTLVWGMVIKP